MLVVTRLGVIIVLTVDVGLGRLAGLEGRLLWHTGSLAGRGIAATAHRPCTKSGSAA